MLADGGEAIADLVVLLRNQAALFGTVALDPTAWRVLSGMDAAALTRLRQARADARELARAHFPISLRPAPSDLYADSR